MPAARLPSGLHTRKNSKGETVYFWDFDFQRRREKLTLGAVPRLEAVTLLTEYRQQLMRESLGLSVKQQVKIPIVAKAIEEYVALMKRNGKDWDSFRKCAVRFRDIQPFRIDRVTEADVTAAVDDMLDDYASKTIQTSLNALGTLFNYGKGNGWCAINPTMTARKELVVTSRVPEQWHPKDDHKILSVMAVAWARASFLLALDMGLRISSIHRILRDDVEFGTDEGDVEWVKVRVSFLKGSKPPEYKISYSPRLIQALKEQRAAAESEGFRWLFPANAKQGRKGEARCKNSIRLAVVDSVETVMKRRIWFHDLRHMFVSRMKAYCPNQNVVMAASSHESFSASKIYTDLNSAVGVEMAAPAFRDFALNLQRQIDSKTVN